MTDPVSGADTRLSEQTPPSAVRETRRLRLFLQAAGFGAGAVLALLLIVEAVIGYQWRPKHWNDHALSASFDTLGFTTRPQADSYLVECKYNIQNNTDSTYSLNPSSLTLMARASDGSLSKEWGNYQSSEPTLTGPPFIPAHSKVKITLQVAYAYPNDFTPADKNDAEKVLKSVNLRLSELNGIVIFDESKHYRVNLESGWEDVKKSKGN